MTFSRTFWVGERDLVVLAFATAGALAAGVAGIGYALNMRVVIAHTTDVIPIKAVQFNVALIMLLSLAALAGVVVPRQKWRFALLSFASVGLLGEAERYPLLLPSRINAGAHSTGFLLLLAGTLTLVAVAGRIRGRMGRPIFTMVVAAGALALVILKGGQLLFPD